MKQTVRSCHGPCEAHGRVPILVPQLMCDVLLTPVFIAIASDAARLNSSALRNKRVNREDPTAKRTRTTLKPTRLCSEGDANGCRQNMHMKLTLRGCHARCDAQRLVTNLRGVFSRSRAARQRSGQRWHGASQSEKNAPSREARLSCSLCARSVARGSNTDN